MVSLPVKDKKREIQLRIITIQIDDMCDMPAFEVISRHEIRIL